MIRLTCTQCKSLLEMDDAFAGGVCRCQYCGTIQTVPAHLKNSATQSGATVTGAKRLYQGGKAGASAQGGGNGTGTGLDELADVVASSGLARSALRRGPDKSGAAQQAGPNRLPVLAAAGAVIIVLLGVIVWLATRSGTGPNASGAPGTSAGPINPDSGSQGTSARVATSTHPGGPVTVNASAGPHYMSVPVSASRVVYVVDRGGSARDIFDPIKASVYSSVESLGPDREFAVIFWGAAENPDWKTLSYPKDGYSPATPDKIQACRDFFENLSASGVTEPAAAVTRAAALNPDAIFLITAKGSDLDSAVVDSVHQAAGGGHARIYTIDLTNGGEGKSVLESIAAQSGGSYTRVSPTDLR